MPITRTLVFSANSTRMSACLNITANIDNLVESPERILVSISSSDPAVFIMQENAIIELMDITSKFSVSLITRIMPLQKCGSIIGTKNIFSLIARNVVFQFSPESLFISEGSPSATVCIEIMNNTKLQRNTSVLIVGSSDQQGWHGILV